MGVPVDLGFGEGNVEFEAFVGVFLSVDLSPAVEVAYGAVFGVRDKELYAHHAPLQGFVYGVQQWARIPSGTHQHSAGVR